MFFYVSTDYDEFHPETYRGVRIECQENGHYTYLSSTPDRDYAAMRDIVADVRRAGHDVSFASSWDHFQEDRRRAEGAA